VIEPNTVTVPPALTVVGVTPSDSWAVGPVVCANAATDNRLRAANAANHLNENLAIRNHSPLKLDASEYPTAKIVNVSQVTIDGELQSNLIGSRWVLHVRGGGMGKTRPFGVIALALLFAIGTCASFISAVSLAFPGSFLEPVWRLKPNARAGFTRIGSAAIVLMIAVCVACTFTATGLWMGRRWGYWLAVVMLVMNLCGDVVNVVTGAQPRAIIGIPIAGLILVYLLRERTRSYFNDPAI